MSAHPITPVPAIVAPDPASAHAAVLMDCTRQLVALEAKSLPDHRERGRILAIAYADIAANNPGAKHSAWKEYLKTLKESGVSTVGTTQGAGDLMRLHKHWDALASRIEAGELMTVAACKAAILAAEDAAKWKDGKPVEGTTERQPAVSKTPQKATLIAEQMMTDFGLDESLALLERLATVKCPTGVKPPLERAALADFRQAVDVLRRKRAEVERIRQEARGAMPVPAVSTNSKKRK